MDVELMHLPQLEKDANDEAWHLLVRGLNEEWEDYWIKKLRGTLQWTDNLTRKLEKQPNSEAAKILETLWL